MWTDVLLWIVVAVGGLIALYFFATMLTTAIVFTMVYSRVQHEYSRRALFSDFPEIKVERDSVTYGRKKRLAVYILGAENTRGLVVISHGIRDRGEGYFTEARAFLSMGYQVLLYDAVGSGNSTGRSQRGLPQSAIDLNRILNWAEAQRRFQGLDFYLYGHSWGGYAVCAVFCYGAHERVKAVASLSGFNDPCRMMLESGSVLSEHFGRFVYIPMRIVQFMRFGRNMYKTAEKGMRCAKGVRFLILHAEEDATIRADGAAIYARREALKEERIRFLLVPGRHHLNAWLDEACVLRNAVWDSKYQAIVGKYGFRMSKKKEHEFYAPIDRKERIALSVYDEAFFKTIVAFYREEPCPNTI